MIPRRRAVLQGAVAGAGAVLAGHAGLRAAARARFDEGDEGDEGSEGDGTGAVAEPPFGVLVVTATAGFRHGSIPAAIAALQRAGEQSAAFTTTVLAETADLSALSAGLLAQQRVVVFANTSGELPLDEHQQAALLAFVRDGGGFVGAHSAADTCYSWPDYGELVGAYFREHPWTQRVTVVVEDAEHPATRGLPPAFDLEEEIYVFRSDVRLRPATRVLLSLDPASVGATGDYPLAWCSAYGAGRTFYTALGHFDGVWDDERFTAHLLGAIRWAGGGE